MAELVFPLFSDGVNLTEKELLACQRQASALPDRRGKARHAQAGTRASLIKGRGMEFAEVRRYQAGDDVRTIDWRVTARTGKAHTKLFVEERERPVILLVDLGDSARFGSSLLLQSVQIAHVSATLGWHACQQGDRLGALVCSEHGHIELKPKSRRQGVMALIQALVLQHQRTDNQPHQADYLQSALQRLRRLAKPGSLIHVISDGSSLDTAAMDQLARLKRQCDLNLVQVVDPFRLGQQTWPVGAELAVLDGRRRGVLNRAGYRDYASAQQERQQALKHWAQQHQVRWQAISAAKPLASQLRELS
ncbi:DUF58 domain-containing protein [Paraferrimonas sedimenticola]|uniref:DUF58 domain-containing protein n=1 Tax=Paraferrimonas sedimenticola TaxID=375674 RepID=A0AA37W1Q5_9GAMM|nr:DUF58 domain-containing protein [Paraferrimonas sedimenticola]GLP96597.1 hypothetical protein GCM10007895_19030 [Paraferrimonas sedimenticola]